MLRVEEELLFTDRHSRFCTFVQKMRVKAHAHSTLSIISVCAKYRLRIFIKINLRQKYSIISRIRQNAYNLGSIFDVIVEEIFFIIRNCYKIVFYIYNVTIIFSSLSVWPYLVDSIQLTRIYEITGRDRLTISWLCRLSVDEVKRGCDYERRVFIRFSFLFLGILRSNRDLYAFIR